MDLFNSETVTNLLPFDGIVNYFGRIIEPQASSQYLQKLLHSIDWKNDEAVIFGKHIITKRKVAWYGDNDFAYTYSNTTKQALPWTNELLQLKGIAEKLSACSFNSCLLNLYHDGDEGMSWHSDNERSLGRDTAIASISFGAERKFMFKHKTTKQTVPVILENGSLLVMKGSTQTNWLHSLPKTTRVATPRINLTFRSFLTK
ncbi:MAG: alpha-ketoglutarate-dependent dioxygenase AlkB [Bacteroidota bacterium]